MTTVRPPRIRNGMADVPVTCTRFQKSPSNPMTFMPSLRATNGKSITRGSKASERRFQNGGEISTAAGIRDG